jgi:hypothetical protein
LHAHVNAPGVFVHTSFVLQRFGVVHSSMSSQLAPPGQVKPRSTAQAKQPSPAFEFPSSHASPGSKAPSPQVFAHREGVPEHTKLASTVQPALHPSPFTVFVSSQPPASASAPTTMPSPQLAEQTVGL